MLLCVKKADRLISFGRCLNVAATSNSSLANNPILFPSPLRRGKQEFCAIRHLSTRDVFYRQLPTEVNKIIPETPNFALKPTLEEMAKTGQSVLDELDLWSWWKPSSWMRWALESMHFATDLPWWATIMITTVGLRLLLIWIPLNMQKMVAKQQAVAPELAEFSERMMKANRENNQALLTQILWEQRDFMSEKGIRPMRQLPLMLGNAAVFATQFFALRGMCNTKYPGFQTEGLYWFTDLSTSDPFWALPILSSLSMYGVIKGGLEYGNLDMMTPWLKYSMVYGLPLIIIIFSNQFPAAVCLYWCTNNAFSLAFSRILRLPKVRKMVYLPPLEQKSGSHAGGGFMKDISELKKGWKSGTLRTVPAKSVADMKRADMEQFKKAGRGKPIYFGDKEKVTGGQ